MNTPTTSTKRPQKISTDALFSRIQVEDSFKAKAYAAFVGDLKFAWGLAASRMAAASSGSGGATGSSTPQS